jgi:hypothetical protein
MPISLRESMRMARTAKELEILEVIRSRTDLTYEIIGKAFGVSGDTIKVINRRIGTARVRGPKKQNPQVVPNA